jgi:sulfur carrier protein ThiS
MADTAPSATLTVQCRLVGELRRYLPGGDRGEGPVQMPASASIDDLLAKLAIPERELLIVGINGTMAQHDVLLNEGDEVTIVAPMTGGAAPAHPAANERDTRTWRLRR